MVGDRDMDIQAGKAAGTRTILIKSKEKTTEQADYSCPSLLDASHLIFGARCRRSGRRPFRRWRRGLGNRRRLRNQKSGPRTRGAITEREPELFPGLDVGLSALQWWGTPAAATASRKA